MDLCRTGNLLIKLRKEKGLTQAQLADLMNISDRTVSKWERGLGFPDVNLIGELSEILEVDSAALLRGEIPEKTELSGSIKNMSFYYCKNCGNVVTDGGAAEVSCCGKKLKRLQIKRVEADRLLNVTTVENEYLVTSDFRMTKEDFVSFIAYLGADTMIYKRLFPEWDMCVRFPKIGRGKLVWFSEKGGLLWQPV